MHICNDCIHTTMLSCMQSFVQRHVLFWSQLSCFNQRLRLVMHVRLYFNILRTVCVQAMRTYYRINSLHGASCLTLHANTWAHVFMSFVPCNSFQDNTKGHTIFGFLKRKVLRKSEEQVKKRSVKSAPRAVWVHALCIVFVCVCECMRCVLYVCACVSAIAVYCMCVRVWVH